MWKKGKAWAVSVGAQFSVPFEVFSRVWFFGLLAGLMDEVA